ncbi:hypothetical protein Tco_0835346, partial [Tanacetum coccineum]
DAKLKFVEELVKILEREFKKLKRSRIAIVKVRWNLKRGLEFTWEREDQMRLKYPQLFSAIGAYDLGVATPRALVYAGLMTSGDARSWYMISGDAKSWVKLMISKSKRHLVESRVVCVSLREASSDRSGSREQFADAVFGAVVAVDELSGVWLRRLSVQPIL